MKPATCHPSGTYNFWKICVTLVLMEGCLRHQGRRNGGRTFLQNWGSLSNRLQHNVTTHKTVT